ncbi:phage/plasmid primase, P4 family [Rhizobium sp. CBN3]|uniref:DNA primase family protein n=1 Tax=Rhizobium sp. CBN3 TaxID=3058045 RepID=UPI0026717FB4|nr:DNA primase family protein [Rhizobium sp. CBN3]MDO3434347.1 phage/plasmid primase, P4 family [Rhizobium sp. CBN3]
MLDNVSTEMPDGLKEIIQAAMVQRGELDPETPPVADDHAETLDDGAAPPDDGDTLKQALEYCAGLDHSDTDNGKRLLKHFGDDLLVVSQEKAKAALYAVWTGTHWDIANGGPKSLAIVQQLGDRIMLERHYIKPTQKEQEAIDAGKAAADAEAAGEEIDVTKRRLIASREKALDAFSKRVKRRLDHAVSSKNVARMNAALACAAPHIIRSPDDLNADRMRFAVHNATISFQSRMERRKNPKFVSPAETPNVPETVDVCIEADVKVHRGHRREDLITHVVPVDYQPKAKCPRWMRFLETMLPDADVRRLVQVSSGLGLVGLTVQKLFFHYGDGANGKSVYMETLCRLLGEVAVTLPATSLIGESGSSGGASPDLARLLGRRLLRVKELPEGEDLKENLVKELTGGETITARDLFQGYMDFDPIFVVQMSGNGYPRITGNDDGIWRRMAVVHWPVKVPEAERRPFDEMIAYFRQEYPGILNWLIEGVRIYLREGLVIPEAVKAATQDYRDDMDRTSAFVARCVVKEDDAPPLQSKFLYAAYCRFTEDEGGKPMNVTAFGRAMSKKFKKETSGNVFYLGIRLRDVPQPRHDDIPQPPPGRFDDDAPLPEVYE